jgi:predicted phosphodiesterase
MRLAIIADIHSNVSALEAILADLKQQEVAETIVAGDLVNRGPETSAVLNRLVPLGWRTIMGNHEDLMLQFLEGRADPAWYDDPWWASSRFAASQINSTWHRYIASLPPQLLVHPPGTTPIRVVHGSPRHFMEGIGPKTPAELLDTMLENVAEPLLVCAHTHYAMIRPHGQTLVVNTGAVGLPFNRDTRAQYALFDWTADHWQITLRQVEYDRAATEAAYQHTGFLQSGGLGARLLLHELQTARPYLVPFWKFCTEANRPLDTLAYDEFMLTRDQLPY